MLAQNTQGTQGSVGSYILALEALSPKETVVRTQQVVSPKTLLGFDIAALASYGPYFLFFALFISALGIQLFGKVRDFRSTVTALVIALLLAATPMVINRLNEQGTQQFTKAGPDEVPRAVKIEQVGSSSITVSWKTDAQKSGSVRFGPVPLSEETSQVYIANSGIVGTHHTAVINAVKPNRVYELEILSGATWYNFNGKPLRIPVQQKTK